MNKNVNCEIVLENELPIHKHKLVKNKLITAKKIRSALVDMLSVPDFPYMNPEKFQLEFTYQHNRFVLIRKAIHAPRDRFFKYRTLHGDIFCNERMFRFRMVASPMCRTVWELRLLKQLNTYYGNVQEQVLYGASSHK